MKMQLKMNGNVIMNVPEELVKWADFSLQTLNSMLVEKFNSIKSTAPGPTNETRKFSNVSGAQHAGEKKR